MKPKRALTLRMQKSFLVLSVILMNHFFASAQAPANDLCANAIALPTGTCNGVVYNMRSATYTAGSGATACTGTDLYDAWFTFVATTVNPTITLSGIGGSFNNPRIQILRGSCGSFTMVGTCSNSPYNPTNLTTGETYYLRIYSTSGTIPTTATNGAYSICISNPARPGNDLCANATILTPSGGTTCAGVGGTLFNATASTGFTNDCGKSASPDVWYRFTTGSAGFTEVNLTNAGAQFRAGGVRMQLISGSCALPTVMNCTGTNGANLTLSAPGGQLPAGTYYVRVFSDTISQNANTWAFNICVRNASNANVHSGKTYVNITKGSNGGTIEPNDELEVRAVLNIKTNAIFNAFFTDNIPTNTTYIAGSLKILTNEGLPYRNWSDGALDDPGTYNAIGGTVRINLGTYANSVNGGSVRATDRPSLFGTECILIASYRVRVNAISYGTVLQMGGGSFSYRDATNATIPINFSAMPATVYPNYGICNNTVGSNGILSEFGGSFGNGTTKDRAASNKVPANYGYVPFNANAPGDYFYGISNNSSTNTVSTNPAEPFGSPSRVFGHWDIIGDHTGATNPLAGNAPVAVGTPGGYMVVVNAAYRADTAFQDTVRNLCPNTSYEYSAWFRNICRTCGGDSTGTSYTAYPVQPADMSGVKPNLTFNINGQDYYTTGNVEYTNQWIKKGFTYRTGPSETQMIINIRNNAPGGGGNDWAIDDIGVATCSPALVLNPATPIVNVCYGDGQSLSAQVVSYYDNYTQYIWERSNDSGTTWTSTAFAGSGTPVSNGTEYEYTAVGPSLIGDSTTHRAQFRLRVASSPTNLADVNCSFRAIRTIQVMVNNCMYVLKTKLTNVSGTLVNSYGNISWTSTNEEKGVQFVLEKSTDGTHFKQLATLNGIAPEGFGNKYHYADPTLLQAPAYYRVVTKERNGSGNSKLVLLSPATVQFEIKNVLNPFDAQLSFDVVAPVDGSVRVSILDNYGRIIRSFNQQVSGGVTQVRISDHGAIGSGVYALKAEYGGISVIKRIVKVNN